MVGHKGRHQCQSGKQTEQEEAWAKALTVVSIGKNRPSRVSRLTTSKFESFYQALGPRAVLAVWCQRPGVIRTEAQLL